MKHKSYSSILDLESEHGRVSLENLMGLQDSLNTLRKFENSFKYATQFCTEAQRMLKSVGLWSRVHIFPTKCFFGIYDEVLKQEIGLSYLRPAPLGCGLLRAFTDCFGVESTFQGNHDSQLIVVRIPDLQLFEENKLSMVPYCTLLNGEELITYLPRFSRKYCGDKKEEGK